MIGGEAIDEEVVGFKAGDGFGEGEGDLGEGGEVIVSRGEQVEIGGGQIKYKQISFKMFI